MGGDIGTCERRHWHLWEETLAPVRGDIGTCGRRHQHLWEETLAPVGGDTSTCGRRHQHLWEETQTPVGGDTSTCGRRHQHFREGNECSVFSIPLLGCLHPPHLPPLREQSGSNAWVFTSTPPSTATRVVWQQCLGVYIHPTFHRYESSVAAMLGSLRPPHLPLLREQCCSNAWVFMPTPPSSATREVWQQSSGFQSLALYYYK